MNKKNILVTGGNGFLGKYICRDLYNLGFNVTTFQRKKGNQLPNVLVTEILGDITNISDIRNALQGIDAVIHTASKVGMWGRYQEFYNINYIGTKNLVECMKELNIDFLVYTSTPSVVFGDDHLENVNESIPYPHHFLNAYGKTKALAEKYVLSSHNDKFKTVSLRPHLIFGPGDLNLIPKVIKAYDEGRIKIIGDGKNLVDVSYVENVSEIHVLALKKLIENSNIAGKAYFIGQGPIGLWDFTNKILEKYNRRPLEKKVPLFIAYAIGAFLEFLFFVFRKYNSDPPMTRFVALQLGKSHYFDHSNLIKDFGYQYRFSIDEGIKKLN